MDFTKVIGILKNFDIKEFVLCGNGGEPVEHHEIEKVLKQLISFFPHTSIHISTNGEMIRDKLSPEFLNLSQKQVEFQIAIDGNNSEIHTLTRKKGNLESVFESIRYLLDHQANISLIYSRHQANEHAVQETHRLLMEKFNLPLFFRDTTIVTESVKPPVKISKNGNVSILYRPLNDTKHEFTPNMKNLYIEHDGECYPCVSFCKNKTTKIPVNIYNYQDSISFLKDYIEFQKSFCNEYQNTGDLRQCYVNCGIYRNNFRYDTLEDLKAL